MFRSVDLSLPEAAWQERARVLLDRIRVAVARHPAVVPLVLRHRQAAPGSLRLIEAMLSVLSAGGLAGTDRVLAQRTLIDYLLGFLQNEHYAALSGPGTIRDVAAVSRRVPPDHTHCRRRQDGAAGRGVPPRRGHRPARPHQDLSW